MVIQAVIDDEVKSALTTQAAEIDSLRFLVLDACALVLSDSLDSYGERRTEFGEDCDKALGLVVAEIDSLRAKVEALNIESSLLIDIHVLCDLHTSGKACSPSMDLGAKIIRMIKAAMAGKGE